MWHGLEELDHHKRPRQIGQPPLDELSLFQALEEGVRHGLDLEALPLVFYSV